MWACSASCVVTARHGRGHVDRPLAACLVVGDEDQRLAGVLQHQRHLRVVGGVRRHVRRDADRHHEADVGQRVAQVIAVDEVLLGERAVLAGLRVEQIQAVRPGAEVDLGPFEEHGRRALAVAHDDAAGDGGDGVFDHGSGDLHQVAVGDERAGLAQHLDGFRVEEADAGAAQRLQRGQVQILPSATRRGRRIEVT